MNCPKCGNDWIADLSITMTIKKSLEITKHKGVQEPRWKCIECGYQWGTYLPRQIE